MFAIPDFCEKMIKSLKHFLSKNDPNATNLFNYCSKAALSSTQNEPMWFSYVLVKQYRYSRFTGDISKMHNVVKPTQLIVFAQLPFKG